MTIVVTQPDDSKARGQASAQGAPHMDLQMNATIDIVRGELERLFSLEEMTSLSEQLLGLDPSDVGGTSAKGSFAKALPAAASCSGALAGNAFTKPKQE